MTLKLQGFPLFVFILIGHLGAFLGTAVTNFALGIWAYEKAGNVGDFTLIGVASTVPALLLGPFIGVVIDRLPRKTLLFWSQVGSTLVMATIAMLYLKNQLTVWWIILVVPFGAIFGAALQVGFTSTITLIVGKDRLNQANGLLGLAFGIIQLGGPLLGSIALDHSSLKVILIATLAAYGVGLATLVLSRIPSTPQIKPNGADKVSVLADLKDGYRYLQEKKGLLGGLWLFTVVWFCVSIVQILFVPVVLGLGTKTDLGLVQTIGGLGLLAGGILMVAWKGPQRLAYGIAFPCFILGTTFILMPISTSITVLTIGTFLVMLTIPIANAASQTLWQRKTAMAYQGRVFALRNTIMKSAQPLAYLTAGFLADQYFEPALMVEGALANTMIGDVWGTGTGRGSALMMSLFGTLCFIIVVIGFSNSTIRRSDIDLPDYDTLNTKK